MSAGSTIEAPRVCLRPMVAGDAPAVLALAGDWRVAAMLADMPFPLTLEVVEAWVERPPAERGYAILLARNIIGSVSIMVDPRARGIAEIGFWLGRRWWGQGFAREAAAAVMAHEHHHSGLDIFTAGHFADNPVSGRVLRGLGFRPVGQTQAWCLARRAVLHAERYEMRYPADGLSAGGEQQVAVSS